MLNTHTRGDINLLFVRLAKNHGQFHPSLHGGLSVERSGALVSELAPPLAVDD